MQFHGNGGAACATEPVPREAPDLARSGAEDTRKEPADKPGSVEDNHSSGTAVTSGLKRPTREPARATVPQTLRPATTPLFGLAPGGVYLAAACYHPRGALLPHHFTLTTGVAAGAVSFLLHFPWTRVPQALPGTLPAGARTFLPLNHRSGAPSDCLAGSSDHLRPVAGPETGGQAPFSRAARCSKVAGPATGEPGIAAGSRSYDRVAPATGRSHSRPTTVQQGRWRATLFDEFPCPRRKVVRPAALRRPAHHRPV